MPGSGVVGHAEVDEEVTELVVVVPLVTVVVVMEELVNVALEDATVFMVDGVLVTEVLLWARFLKDRRWA